MIEYTKELRFYACLLQVIWRHLSCRYPQLLICVAILEEERAVILGKQLGFTEILQVLRILHRHYTNKFLSRLLRKSDLLMFDIILFFYELSLIKHAD